MHPSKPASAAIRQSSVLPRLLFCARLVFVIGILGIIGSHLDWYQLWRAMSNVRLSLVLLSFSLIAGLQFAVVFRWYVLLRALDTPVPLLPLLAFHLVGIFYSQFLPTSIGGDMAKGYYLSRTHTDRIEVVSSALVDRLIGLVSNGLIGLFALSQALEVLRIFGLSSRLVTLILLVSLGGILVGYGILLYVQQWTGQLPPFLRSVNNVIACEVQHPFVVILAVLISVGHFLGWAFCIWLLAIAVQITDIAYVTVLLLLAAVNVAQFVPLSINGWGIREGALVVLLGLYNVSAESAVTLSLLIAFSGLMLAVVGGWIVLVDYRYKKQAASKAATCAEVSNTL